MKVSPSRFSPPEACAPTPASPRLSFKSALSEAERLIERQGAMLTPSPGRFTRCNDPPKSAAAQTIELTSAEPEPELPDRPRGKPDDADAPAVGAPDCSLPARIPVADDERRCAQAPLTSRPELPLARTEPNGRPLPGDGLTDTSSRAQHAAIAATLHDARPIDAEPASDLQANAPGNAQHWTPPPQAAAFQPRTPPDPQGENTSKFMPTFGRPLAGRSLALAQAGELKDDGRKPLGFAEPGVIRPLRPSLEHFDLPPQSPANQAPPAAAPPQVDIEDRERAEPPRGGDQFTPRPATSNTDSATTRHPRTPRVSPFALAHPRPSLVSAPTGAANLVAPARRGEQEAAPQRAAPSKAQLPHLPTRPQQRPSIVFHELAGALELIVGVAGATPELRARLKPALAALAADYGLRIAHMTLNGVSVERAAGSKGG